MSVYFVSAEWRKKMASEDMALRKRRDRLQKSYFDVLGLYCSSVVTLVERILKAIEGVQEVCVIVPSRTVIFFHDNQSPCLSI